jgi:hypothetical protein
MERIGRSPGRRTLLHGIFACLLSVGVAGCAGPGGEEGDDEEGGDGEEGDDEEGGDGEEGDDEEGGDGEEGDEEDGGDEEDEERMSRPTGL